MSYFNSGYFIKLFILFSYFNKDKFAGYIFYPVFLNGPGKREFSRWSPAFIETMLMAGSMIRLKIITVYNRL